MPAAWPADGWWRSYGDPQLDALVDEALAGSPSLEIAQARLRAAQAQTVVAAGRTPRPRWPSTPRSRASATRSMVSTRRRSPVPMSTDARAALDFSWDLDFWGRNRALIAAARAGEQAAAADREAARLALAVAVVRAYIQLDLQYALLDVTNDNLKQQSAILELTQQRVSAGLENTARVKQSEGTVALTRAGLALRGRRACELARNQLADLVGAGPDRGQSIRRPQLNAPLDLVLPSTLPADLLGRRPDVAAARSQVESASRGIKAAEADFYPNVNLTAFAGFQAIGLSQLFDASDRDRRSRPRRCSLPVFNRDALRGAALRAPGAARFQSVGAVQPDAARCGARRRRRRDQLACAGA